MDKLIVTSLRVNKNQKKFAPSLKKVKKNRNKKLANNSKSKSEDNNVKNKDENSNKNIENTKQTNVEKTTKDLVVIKKLDTLKESKIFGLNNSFVGPKKNVSNSRLKLLAELEDEQSKTHDSVQSPEITNSPATNDINHQVPIIPVKILAPSDLINENEILTPASLSPTPKDSNEKVTTNSSIKDSEKKIVYQSSKSKFADNAVTIQSLNSNLSSLKNTPQTISIPSTPALSDDEITLTKIEDNQDNIKEDDNNSVVTLEFNQSEPNKISNNYTKPIPINTPPLRSSNQIKTSTINELNLDKISKNLNDKFSIDSDLKLNESLSENDLKNNNNSSKILSEQNSSNRKRKSDDNENDNIDENKISPLCKKRQISSDDKISSDTSSSKRNLTDLEDVTYNLLTSKLNKLRSTNNALEKKISKLIDSIEDGINETENVASESDTDKISESDTIVEIRAEKNKNDNDNEDGENINDSVNNDENNDNDNDNGNDNDEDDDDDYEKQSKSFKGGKMTGKLNNLKKGFRAFSRKSYSAMEKEEPIVFSKRTLADIIDNYHGKERSNIQKERYKLAARKRKATLRRKRLGITEPESEGESVKAETTKPIEKKPTENVAAVQMRVVNGEAVIDLSSININQIDTSNELPITLKENQEAIITSLSFKKNSNRSKKWKKDETDLFYQCISICGTDFGMMSAIMPHRNRKQLINKYHRETRLNPERVRKAFEKRKILDNKNFNAILEKIKNKEFIDISNYNAE